MELPLASQVYQGFLAWNLQHHWPVKVFSLRVSSKLLKSMLGIAHSAKLWIESQVRIKFQLGLAYIALAKSAKLAWSLKF